MKTNLVSGIALAIMTGSAAIAAPVALPSANFAGSGIDNTQVIVSNTKVGTDTITLGLTATSEFTPTLLSNDGNSTFYAHSGIYTANQGTWNFDFYASVAGTPGAGLGSYTFVLLYSLTANAGTPLGQLKFGSITTSSPVALQNSQNLGFAYLGNPTSLPAFVTPPSGAYNPLASGDYVFTLEAIGANGQVVASDTMTVAVLPDAGSSSLLLSLGLGGLIAYNRVRRQAIA